MLHVKPSVSWLATGELRPGSILLLHFGPDLARDLRAATRAIESAGLTPANLADYLSGESNPRS